MCSRPFLAAFGPHRSFGRSALWVAAFAVLASVRVAYAAPPAWWMEQGVLSSGTSPDNYAVANVGQMKNMAAKAAAEFNVKLAALGGAGDAINLMVAAWPIKTDDVPADPNNYAILNQGQLKMVAQKFYDRLAELGYKHRQGHLEPGESYPWTTANTADNDHFAPVILGQLKHVFNFISIRPFGGVPGALDTDGDGLSDADETALGTNPLVGHSDTDGDGIPDGWEVFFGLNPLVQNQGQAATDGDHLSDLMEFLLRTRPDVNDQDLRPKLSAGGGQTLHTLASGVLQAWGDNRSGQCGGDTSMVVRRMEPSSAPANTIEIASGWAHSIALTQAGYVYAAGENEFGQLGVLTPTRRSSFEAVAGLANVVQVAAGEGHSLALDGDGVVWAWGANYRGQGIAGAYAPQVVSGLPRIARIGAGARYSVALDVNGKVWAWGDNSFGQLAVSSPAFSDTPIEIGGAGSTLFRQIAVGRHHTLALDKDGAVWAWGANFAGQLGDGGVVGSCTPVRLESLGGLKSIAAGGLHSLAITSADTLLGWGANERGQLGLGASDLTDHVVPVTIPGVATAVRVAAGHAHSVVLRSNDSLLAWGDNFGGRLGLGVIATPIVDPSTVLPVLQPE